MEKTRGGPTPAWVGSPRVTLPVSGGLLSSGATPHEARDAGGRRWRRWRPTGDVEDEAVVRDVVLDADVEVGAGGVEDTAGPLGRQVVQRADPHAAIAQQVFI